MWPSGQWRSRGTVHGSSREQAVRGCGIRKTVGTISTRISRSSDVFFWPWTSKLHSQVSARWMAETGPLWSQPGSLHSCMGPFINHTSWAQRLRPRKPLLLLEKRSPFQWFPVTRISLMSQCYSLISMLRLFVFCFALKKFKNTKDSENTIHFSGELGISHTIGTKWISPFWL